MSCYPQKPKAQNMEPYLNHSRKEMTENNPNLIKIIVSYRFPMGSLSWIGDLTLFKTDLD